MKASRLTMFAVALALGSGITTAHGDALGTAFTYQGQLKDEGVPANDEYDFVFRLFEDPVGGAQVGDDLAESDWTVSDGLFTIEVDFGTDVFTGDALWLEVGVRLTDSGGEYTNLSPRQPLNATPYALYALDGPGATGFWEAVGDNIMNTNSGFVGVNRTDQVTGAEFFGIQTPTGENQWGGMYIRTDSATGKPFYGYDVGTERAWTYLDGSTGRWTLYNGGDRITVKNTGEVGIGTPSPSTALEVNGTATATAFVGDGSGLTGIPGALWQTSGSDIYYNAGNVGIGPSNPDPLYKLDVWGDISVGGSRGGVDAFTSKTMTFPWYSAVYGDAYNLETYGYLGGIYGAYGRSAAGTGVKGVTESNSLHASGVEGVVDDASPGMYSAGVLGHNNGTGNFGYGVHGSQDGSGVGVYGSTPSGYGVYGITNEGTGVYGRCDGTGFSGIGVHGSHGGYGTGVYGVSANGIGVYGTSTNGTYAGYFDGTVNVDVLEISGADVAEKFPVSEEVEPGMVVAIDPKHPGQLCLARGTYNRCVAGVVSGAGDLPAGAVLGHMPGYEDAPPIALSGRVWVKCDATETAIELGDLLTTSDTPGHAMAVSDFSRAHGAVIGKAMTRLEEGTGLVLVLVNLQ